MLASALSRLGNRNTKQLISCKKSSKLRKIEEKVIKRFSRPGGDYVAPSKNRPSCGAKANSWGIWNGEDGKSRKNTRV
jgi:hypothetical protein